MSKSQRLTIDEVRLAMRVVGDCRDVGRDPSAWNQRISCFFLDQLRSVFTSCFTQTMTKGVPTALSLCAFWADNRLHARWLKFMQDHGYRKYLSVQRFGQMYAGQSSTFRRQDLVKDGEWKGGDERADRMAVHQDEMMISVQNYINGISHVFSINREIGDLKFTAREQNLVRLIHEELGHLFGSRLSLKLETQALPPDLSPRLQAVFICLMSGDSEKEIAKRLNLSVHTVHEYVKKLFRRFGVTSRGELFTFAHRNNWIPGELAAK